MYRRLISFICCILMGIALIVPATAEYDGKLPNDAAAPTPEQTAAWEEQGCTDDELCEYISDCLNAYQNGSFDPVVQRSVAQLLDTAEYELAEEYIIEQLMLGSERIYIKDYMIPTENFNSFANSILNDHPELYYIKNWAMQYKATEPYIYYIVPKFYEYDFNHGAFDSAVGAALSAVRPGMNDVEKAIALHDYLVINCRYDYDNYLNNNIPQTSYSAYGALVLQTAVCQGYALAYKYLCDQLGIGCCIVTSSAMNHAWNLVELDGSYYHVDATWDDPTRDRYGLCQHLYLLRSDTGLQNHYSWEVTKGAQRVNIFASDPRFDAGWRDIYSPMIYLDDTWYYMRGGTLFRAASPTAAAETVTAGDTWMHSGLFEYGGSLYFNGEKSIYCFDPEMGDINVIFREASENSIYGIGRSAALLYYAPRSTYNSQPGNYLPVFSGVRLDAGDINRDGKVNVKDAVMLLKCVTDELPLPENASADTNGDGTVNLKDAVLLLKYVMGEAVHIE